MWRGRCKRARVESGVAAWKQGAYESGSGMAGEGVGVYANGSDIVGECVGANASGSDMAGAGVSVGDRMRAEAIWSAGVSGKYRRAGGGAKA